MTNKKYIDTYSTIYGVDIVVANMNVKLEDLKKNYVYYDGAVLEDDICTGMATVTKIKSIKTGRPSLLVKLNKISVFKGENKSEELMKTAVHEAGHVCLRIYEYIWERNMIESQEPFCYLLEYIYECIYKTWTKK